MVRPHASPQSPPSSMVEQLPDEQQVLGSIPREETMFTGSEQNKIMNGGTCSKAMARNTCNISEIASIAIASTKIKFMINNTELIKPFLIFSSEDDFYFLQILKRKKEHLELGSNSYTVKTYFIKSLQDLEFAQGEIKCLCDYHNARAYINLNKRSFEKTAFHTLKKITDIIIGKDYKSARKAYPSVCGMYMSESDKKWVVDIDDVEGRMHYVQSIGFNINKLQPEGHKVLALIPTKNGVHLITKPFNTE